MVLVTLVIFSPIEQAKAQTESPPASPASETRAESHDSSIPSQSVKIESSRPAFLSFGDDLPAVNQNSVHPSEQQSVRVNSSAPVPPDAPQPGQRQNESSQNDDPQNTVMGLPRALFHDQIGIWTSPGKARLRTSLA